MATDKRNHRDRKNGASREQWMKRKREQNAARGLSVYRFNEWVRIPLDLEPKA